MNLFNFFLYFFGAILAYVLLGLVFLGTSVRYGLPAKIKSYSPRIWDNDDTAFGVVFLWPIFWLVSFFSWINKKIAFSNRIVGFILFFARGFRKEADQ